ncbi:MAG: DUF2513 domain-containing protein [Alphaproteobacteria bacterium]|nr:MAG: DUF2513 domain-containing protein [Alphaproteobacteria bacterium]
MKRDMDLIRSLVLEIENGKNWYETTSDETATALGTEGSGLSQAQAERLEYHLKLLEDAGFAEFTKTGEGWLPERLSWKGHDFADSVRDEEIWRRTKEGIIAAKGFTVDLLIALAKGFAKKQIEDRTGIAL